MKFIASNRVDIFAIIREISQTISEMSIEVDNQNLLGDEILNDSRTLQDSFSIPGSEVWNLYKSASDLNYAAASRTHDIELVINENRAQSLIRQLQLTPFDIDVGSVHLTATPTGRPSIEWHDPRLSKPDCFLFKSNWTLTGGSTPQNLLVWLELQFTVDVQAAQLKVVQAQSPKITNAQGQGIDPFGQVPMRDGLRMQARQRLFDEVARIAGGIGIDLPANPLSANPPTFVPHTYLIWNRHLVLVCKQLARRRAAEPLGFTLSSPHDQGIRLKKEHVIPQITQEVAAQGVALEALEFRSGYIFLRVHRHEEEGCLWIDVEVDVWFEYRMTIVQNAPAILYGDLRWIQYWYRIHASNCWPVCGSVVGQVKDQVEAEAPKYYEVSFPFANLRATAYKAATRIQPYGLTIMMQTR